MNIARHLTRLLAFVLAVMVMTGNASATSANTDATDIWWNSAKSGAGFQLINTGTFIFATGFVYSGNLVVTTGPYYGGPFDPLKLTRRVAGTMAFALDTITTGRLAYVIDGVSVNESVERQPLTLDSYSGDYLALLAQSTFGCTDPANNGVSTSGISVAVTQNGATMSVVIKDGGETCTLSGTYSQLGRMGQFDATYTCTSGDSGEAVIFQMTNVPFMFSARMQSQSATSGCGTAANIVGLVPL